MNCYSEWRPPEQEPLSSSKLYREEHPRPLGRGKCGRGHIGVILILVLASCEPTTAADVSKIISSAYAVSLLTVNLRGVLDVPCGGSGAPWSKRSDRIAAWIADRGKEGTPDLVALQEVHGWIWCPFNHRTLPDYAQLATLVAKVREATGIEYRIAYLTTSFAFAEGGCGFENGAGLSGCQVMTGKALLYNPKRLVNRETKDPSGAIVYDESTLIGSHLRRSLPCCNPAQDSAWICELVDGDSQSDKCDSSPSGIARTRSIRLSNGAVSVHGAMARFSIVSDLNRELHIYNIHAAHSADNASALTDLADFVATTEHETLRERLFPPIVTGDFNTPDGPPVGQDEAFAEFSVAGFTPPPEVMGTLVGGLAQWPAYLDVEPIEFVEIPSSSCEDSSVAWSDHCNSFVILGPKQVSQQ